MKPKQLKIALAIVLVPLIYWSATAAMIESSARHVAAPRSCIDFGSFPDESFLTLMGRRSIPALRRQIADPNVGLNSKIHVAWKMGQAGDHSQFAVFIEGLKSKRHEFAASHWMMEFPDECQRHLPAILAIGRQNQSDNYRSLLISLAHQNDVPDEKINEIAEIIDNAQSHQRGFNDGEIQQLTQDFAARTERKSRYWATPAKNSSNAARQ